MLKVSWKILSPAEIQAKNFHMVDALVLMPPNSENVERSCLHKTLGLIGFHAVHKTVESSTMDLDLVRACQERAR